MNKNQAALPILTMGELIDSTNAFFTYLRSKWLQAFLLITIGMLITASYYFIQKPKYEGTASFILEEKGGGAGGGLSGLASQFGFDLGSMNGNAGLFAGDNVLSILKSRSIIEKVLLSKVDSTKSTTTLADLYLETSGLHKKWLKDPSIGDINFNNCIPGKPNMRIQDSALFVIFQKLSQKQVAIERISKNGSIIKIVTTSASEIFSKLFTERLVLETMEMYIDIKTSVATKNIKRLEKRSDSLLVLLNSSTNKSAALQLLDANIAYKTAAVPLEVSQREKTVTFTVYTEVVKNLEASRIALANQTPVINILDNAKYPLENQQLSLGLLLLIGFMGGLATSLGLAFINFKPSN